MIRFLGSFGILALLTGTLIAQTVSISPLVKNGPDSERIKVVFMSEGYQSDELSTFRSDAKTASDELFLSAPFNTYKSLFNVYLLEVASQESGADHPKTATDEPSGFEVLNKNTYFNSTFDYAGIHRLLVPDYDIVQNTLADYMPDWDIAMVVVNSKWYGGSGGFISTFSTDFGSTEVAIHELGHSFAALADEYYYETGDYVGYEAPNTTSVTDRNSIKWKDWIVSSTPIPTPSTTSYQSKVGLFEGAVYNASDWFRPKLDCKMRILGVEFCEVCSEQIVKSIYNVIPPGIQRFPLSNKVEIKEGETISFNHERMLPGFKQTWTLDSVTLPESTDTLTISSSQLSNGTHTLTSVIEDQTILIRTDPFNLRKSTVEWTIDVVTETSTEQDEIQPDDIRLLQNYPNPFNAGTIIRFELRSRTNLSLELISMNGQTISTLANGLFAAGSHSVILNSEQLGMATGIYLVRLQTANSVKLNKLTLIK